MTTDLIGTILQRIADNNCRPGTDWEAGRREAYEDVLRIIGYYNDDDEVIVR